MGIIYICVYLIYLQKHMDMVDGLVENHYLPMTFCGRRK